RRRLQFERRKDLAEIVVQLPGDVGAFLFAGDLQVRREVAQTHPRLTSLSSLSRAASASVSLRASQRCRRRDDDARNEQIERAFDDPGNLRIRDRDDMPYGDE